MGYRTPNIDRIAKEGALFTDWYGQQSCTAGRAAFITGQIAVPHRSDQGRPAGAPTRDCRLDDPTIAELLKPQGYATGQFGKNHLGDRDEHLPTVHGFDEFFGNLYHLNAEEEPENVDYPKDPEFKKKFGPRGVLHTWSTARAAEDRGHRPAHQEAHGDGRRGDHRRRRSSSWTQQHKAGKPFFVWWNTTRMHIWTHLKQDVRGQDRPRHLPGRHGRARRAGRAAARRSSTTSASPTTPSSCTRPTTAPRPSPGRTAARRRSAARRRRTGRAATASRRSSAGRA